MPIQEIEEEIKVYTDELETLTKLVIQDNDGSLHINQKLLKQQDIVAKEFNQFMQLHQQDFDALSKQGSIIGLQAKTSLESIDYDKIQVLTPDNKHTLSNCDNAIHVMVM